MAVPFSQVRHRWADLGPDAQARVLARPETSSSSALRDDVAQIIAEVREGGDEALLRLTRRYDRASLTTPRVSAEELSAAGSRLSADEREAIRRAARQIEFFHRPQATPDLVVRTAPGIECSRITRPIEAVGMYAPGGTAPLPSTVLMLSIPARLAGCPRRVLCTPPNPDGSVAPAILFAAHEAGVNEVYKAGGAQAIAAMAYGTQSVPAVDKIFGPGNAWVTEAKQQASLDAAGAACDMPAGPSEVLVIADATARAEFVAADLLSQAEHGVDSQVVLLSTCPRLIDEVQLELQKQLETLSRSDVARQSLNKSALIEVGSRREAIEISNRYAPEHLILQTEDPRALLPQVTNAGSIFVGPWSPEAVGDYASGTNHVLPTYGYARAYSGLSLDAFQKKITVQELTPAGLLDIGPTVETLAALEGLDAHQQAVTRRLARLEDLGDEAPTGDGVSHLARPSVVRLEAYASARSAVTEARLFLDANEVPYSPTNRAAPEDGVNRYPEPQPAALVRDLAALYEVQPENLIVGRGSDDVIDALLRAFCEASRDAILICPPTYGVYRVAADLQGAEVVSVPLDDRFALDVDAVTRAWNPSVKLVFVCSPNNPTGTLTPLEDIRTLCAALSERAVVVVDEAYMEFADAPSATTLLSSFPNLIVLRTLSKAWGLAGARCGVGVANRPLIDLLQKVRAPYPLATPAIELVNACLGEQGRARCRSVVAEIVEERAYLAQQLAALPSVKRVFPSEANFLLVETTGAQEVIERARAQGIIIRDRSNQPNLEGCVRVSVGARAQNQALLDALQPGEDAR